MVEKWPGLGNVPHQRKQLTITVSEIRETSCSLKMFSFPRMRLKELPIGSLEGELIYYAMHGAQTSQDNRNC